MNQQETNHSQIELKKRNTLPILKMVSPGFLGRGDFGINIIIRISDADSPIRFAVGFSITNWLDAHPCLFCQRFAKNDYYHRWFYVCHRSDCFWFAGA